MKLILVEDEPAAMRHLQAIIETRCPGWEIAAMAEDGAEGLEKALALRPDLVMTDIRMPGMDGMTLIERLSREAPDVLCVLVSGYQDFEHARSAIRLGVTDYLLKPVRAQQVQQLLSELHARLVRTSREHRMLLCRQCLAGLPPDAWRQAKYLPADGYRAALLRVGGLPSRLAPESAATATVPELHSLLAHCPSAQETEWLMPGRDDREVLVLSVETGAEGRRFREVLLEVSAALPEGYRTMVICDQPFRVEMIRTVRDALSRTMDRRLVIGRDACLPMEAEVGAPQETTSLLDARVMGRMALLAAQNQAAELKRELVRLFGEWERDACPQWRLERALNQLVSQVAQRAASGVEPVAEADGFRLDELLCDAVSFGEVMAGVWHAIEQRMQPADPKADRMDATVLVREVMAYMDRNLAEPLSLQSVCMAFGVSQTYLSRLFRRHADQSFVECLTAKRMQRARELLSAHPELPLKAVAAHVGFEDPFYFSKVFRAAHGMPPSQYAAGRRLEGGPL